MDLYLSGKETPLHPSLPMYICLHPSHSSVPGQDWWNIELAESLFAGEPAQFGIRETDESQ